MNKLWTSVWLGLLLSFPAAVLAGPPGFYVGASIQSVDAEFRQDDDTDSGWEARLGFALTKNLAVEATYSDLGEVVLPAFPDAGGSVETDALIASAVVKLPLGLFSLVGRGGVLAWDRDGELGSIAGPVSFSDDGFDLVLGAGISFELTDELEIRADYNDADDFSWFAAGINYHF